MAVSSIETTESAAELARLTRDGSQVLAEHFQLHWPRLRAMVELRMDSRVARRLDAVDILQDSFIEASRRLPEYLADPKVPVFIWLRFIVAQRVAIAYRTHVDAAKRSALREQRLSAGFTGPRSDSASQRLVSTWSSPSSVAIRRETHDDLHASIDALHEDDRQILVLRHFEELSNAEVSAELGISPTAASKRYVRAIQRLRDVASLVG